MFTNSVLVRLFMLYSFCSFANGGVLTGISLFASTSRRKGGLGLSSVGVGITYVIFGAGAFLAQSLFFRHYSARNPPRKVFILGATLLAVSSLAIPFTTNGTTMVWVWIFLSVALVVLSCGFMTALPIVNAMLAEAADPRISGLTQGTASSAAALLRGAAPPLGGMMFGASVSLGMPWVLFMFYSATYVVCLAIAFSLPKTQAEETPSSLDNVVVEAAPEASHPPAAVESAPAVVTETASASASHAGMSELSHGQEEIEMRRLVQPADATVDE